MATYEVVVQKAGSSSQQFRTTVKLDAYQVDRYGSGKAAVISAVRNAAEAKHPGWLARPKTIVRRDDRGIAASLKRTIQSLTVPEDEESAPEDWEVN